MLLHSTALSSAFGAHPHHPQPLLYVLFSWCPCCYLGSTRVCLEGVKAVIAQKGAHHARNVHPSPSGVGMMPR